MILSKYCKIYPYKDNQVLLFSTKKASKILLPQSMLEDIEKGDISEEEKKTLIELGFLANSAEEEKKEMLGFIDELNAVNKSLRIILVMNLDCNLACRYCFEGSRKGRFYMTRETADLFVEFVAKFQKDSGQAGMTDKKQCNGIHNEVKITFYGGEPLLSTKLIGYILEKLQASAGNNVDLLKTNTPLSPDTPLHPSQEGIHASLITNGTLLTPEVVGKLKPLGLKAANVTLDGPKEVHDGSRPYKSGRGTFDVIIGNIKEVCDMIDIQLGGNFTQENYGEFPRLLDYLMDNGLTPDKISSVEFSPVINESKEFAPADFHGGCASVNEPWLFEAGLVLRGEILRRGYKTRKITPATCMIEMKDNLVVNYDGSFYKCPGLIERREFKAGDLLNGVNEYGISHNLDNWKNEECLDCSYLPLCFGGCRYMKLLRDNDMKGVDCKKPHLDAALKALVFQDVEPSRP